MNAYVARQFGNILRDLKEITLVAAPPFKEQARIALLKKYIERLGYSPERDREGNLSVRFQGSGSGLLVFSAHVDTVFPEGTVLTIAEKGGKVSCPGICDNSAGIAAQLCLMRYLRDKRITPRSDLIFLFDVGEEGTGNLRGIRCFFDNLKSKDLRAHVCVEGHEIGRLTTRFIGSYRAKVRVSCVGGHGWRDYGRPNAIVIASAVIIRLSRLKLPSKPRATFNVGTITGGTSVNSIAAGAEFSFEVRSLSQKVLSDIVKKFRREIKKFDSKGVKIKIETLGDRPCGETHGSFLPDVVRNVHKKLGIRTLVDSGSTDSNYPASLGLPTVTVGITKGGNTHSAKEYLLTRPMSRGIEQLLLLFHSLDGK